MPCANVTSKFRNTYCSWTLAKGCLLYYCNLSLDTTDEEARNQFLEEIEIMKAIGSHKNIVSMLGCWVNSDPIFLMLEYVPYGDLQHWLRNKRIQVDLKLIRTLSNASKGHMLSKKGKFSFHEPRTKENWESPMEAEPIPSTHFWIARRH